MKNKIDKVLQEAKRLVSLYKATKKRTLKLIIQHEPKDFAMKRPRVGKFKNMYVPDAAKNKKLIRSIIQPQLDKQKFKQSVDYPIEIKINYYTKIPKNFNKVEYLLALKKYIRPVVKPDIDNMEKTYLDALTEVVWVDDSQVISSHQAKFYSDEPRVEIVIMYRPFHLSKKQIKKKGE